MKSYKTYLEQKYSHERWVYIDKLAKSGLLKSDVCSLAPWLFELNGIVMIRTDDYWNQYLLQNWGLNTRIMKNEVIAECKNYETLSDPRKKPI